MKTRVHDIAVRAYLACAHPSSLRDLARRMRKEDQGSTTVETVIIVAVFVAMALGATALIKFKVLDKVAGIKL